MSVMLIRAVAVLDKPKFKLPSMSVAWTMMVYWDTFCKQTQKKRKHSQGLVYQILQQTRPEQSTNIYIFYCHSDIVSHTHVPFLHRRQLVSIRTLYLLNNI